MIAHLKGSLAFYAALLIVVGGVLSTVALYAGYLPLPPWLWAVVLIASFLSAVWCIAYAFHYWHAYRWPLIRHVRYFLLANLVMRSHAAGHIMRQPYHETREEYDYLEDVWRGRA